MRGVCYDLPLKNRSAASRISIAGPRALFRFADYISIYCRASVNQSVLRTADTHSHEMCIWSASNQRHWSPRLCAPSPSARLSSSRARPKTSHQRQMDGRRIAARTFETVNPSTIRCALYRRGRQGRRRRAVKHAPQVLRKEWAGMSPSSRTHFLLKIR